jgi:vacuolar protein sorting-associated protein 35
MTRTEGDAVLLTPDAAVVTVSSDHAAQWLAQSSKTMKRSGFYARQAIKEGQLDDALRHSAVMLGELRTVLVPSAYFELWTIACGELSVLQAFFDSCDEYGYDHARLYQKVQHAGNVLPRLYLMFTVGSSVLHCADATVPTSDRVTDSRTSPVPVSVTELMEDMRDMCKGVQHPMRGLFLRAYLLQSVKGALHAHAEAAIQFLLENFIEMNKLWVRMKFQQGDEVDGDRSREQLADLVGKNLLYLAELVTLEGYASNVLPKILDQVVSCQDRIAQGYLMECITAAFPDDFQIETMDQLLGVLPKLDPSVELAAVLGSMLDRLAKYAQTSPRVLKNLDDMKAFEKIGRAVEASISAHREILSGDSIVSMYGGLLAFADAVYPQQPFHVDEILGRCAAQFAVRDGSESTMTVKTEKKIVELLCIPLENYDLSMALGLEQFSPLFNVLSAGKKKELAYKIAGMVPQRNEVVRDAASARALVAILRALYGIDADEDDARMFSKALHSIRVSDAAQHVQLLGDIVDGLKSRDTMVRCIGPAVVFSTLEVGTEATEETLIFAVGVCVRIASAGAAAQAIGLLLRVATFAAASSPRSKGIIAQECFQNACLIFEDRVFDSMECRVSLNNIIATLPAAEAVLPQEPRDMLFHKVAAYCSKLLMRKDQCRAVLHLSRVERDGSAILARLQRAERIICELQEQDAVFASTRSPEELDVAGHLLVELLDTYLFYRKQGVAEVTEDGVQRITALAEAVAAGRATVRAYLDRVLGATGGGHEHHRA